MKAPLFSIVLPTRDRAHTLKYALHSCLDQDFEDFEVVVFDNSSIAPCAEVVRQVAAAYPGKIVRYERARRPLAMTHSWETALELALGEYVTILGDDDGLIRGGLRFAEALLRRHPSRIIRFAQAAYGWPDHPVAELCHHLLLPLHAYLRRVNGKQILQDVARFRASYFGLPMIYNSVVHRDLLAVTRKRVGRVFLSFAPDVASGMTFAYLEKHFISCGVPIAIRGGSGSSNGAAILADYQKEVQERQKAIEDDFYSLNEKGGLAWSSGLPQIPTIQFPVADCFLTIKQALFPENNSLRLDVPALVRAAAQNLLRRELTADHEYWRKLEPYARQHGCQLPEISASRAGHNGKAESEGKIQPDFGWDTFGGKLGLDASQLGIKNVHDAARFAGGFYQYDEILRRLHLETTCYAATQAAKSLGRILATQNRLRPWEVEL